MTRFPQWLVLISALLAASWTAHGEVASSSGHRRLEFENRFSSAEETLNYFLSRDAAGFVWSGYLDSERAEFTTWKSGPAQDGFYLAKRYVIRSTPLAGDQDQKAFTVEYELESVRDSAGTESPAIEKTRSVRFVLKKKDGKWKVAEPDGARYSSVLISGLVRKDISSR
jgi:hypothetical protein